MGYSPWDLKELDMTDQLILSLSLHPLSEIRCNPPIFFCPLCVCVCVCVCVYTIVLKRQMASVQVELELMKQSKKPLASQMALSLDYDLTQVSRQQS